MKKATCETFESVLRTIHQKGITTKTSLMDDQLLYNDFWFALTEFCHFALLSKTGGKNAKGEILPGNSGKIDALELRGATTRYDIETDCVIKIIEKLDLVLRQPVEKQKNYCYAVCNNMVNDCFRKLPPDEFKIVSLNSTIEGTTVVTEDAYTYEDIIADNTYNPEHLLIERESIETLEGELKAKQDRELMEKKSVILHEISRLSAHATEVFVRLAWHLNIKTCDLAARIIDNGYENTFAQLIIDIATQYNINLEDIRNLIVVSKLTEDSYKKDKGLVKLLSKEAKVVADQISKYKNRAKGHLDKK